MRNLIFLALLVAVSVSCGKDQLEKDVEKIQEFLDDNGLIAQSTDSGLHYIIEDEGEGTEYPESDSDVTLYYIGSLLDGTVFDGSGSNPVTFNLQQVIPGWQEGIQLFKKDAKGILIIPSQLAYGTQGIGPIPPNSVLVFNVEIVDFE